MRRLSFAIALLCSMTSASALEFVSLANNAIVLDANSRLAKPQFILLKGTPVEQLVVLESWVKLREASGGIGWVERSAISATRSVIVTAPTADVRQAATPDAPVVFSVTRDLLLEPVDKPVGPWIKVRHRDGRSGFIEVRAVWGL
ncbi:SH3 domain-containing protein [Viridibacterium curvum]|uniref:SH3b domain-containing protein n=1 Tax=Viridibacterium curvum TaxID=1101404 RepID=A0ABP9QCU0_9RHOO